MAALSSAQETNEGEDLQLRQITNDAAADREEPYHVAVNPISETETDESEDSEPGDLDGGATIFDSEPEPRALTKPEVDNTAGVEYPRSSVSQLRPLENPIVSFSMTYKEITTLYKSTDDSQTPPVENCVPVLGYELTTPVGVVSSQEPPRDDTPSANMTTDDSDMKIYPSQIQPGDKSEHRFDERNQIVNDVSILANMAPNARGSLLEPFVDLKETAMEQHMTLQSQSPTAFVTESPTSEYEHTSLPIRPSTPIPSNVMLHMTLQQHQQSIQNNLHSAYGYPVMTTLPSYGRRKILLRLQEDRPEDKGSFFFRRKSSRSFLYNNNSDFQVASKASEGIPRGQITVSWFEGTTSKELQEHVRNSVTRKMAHAQIADMRILDETVDPPEEIVLSSFIPDGSEFLLRFTSKPLAEQKVAPIAEQEGTISVPLSPSAAPSPFQSSLDLGKLNAHLLARGFDRPLNNRKAIPPTEDTNHEESNGLKKPKDNDGENASLGSHAEDEVMGYSAEDQIEHRLRQLADLLIHEKRTHRRSAEKRQVIFVLANYFILFLSMVAAFAEIQARAPSWLNWVETQMESVQQCATDQEALFECVQRGDFYGLIASFVLWISRSAATKQFFLFGFKSPQVLWTVVYESYITAVCWGTSYMLIRRALNPDTRKNFLKKYWKDAVYGSLAGFNAAFMKHVLKNLIPQEALEEALMQVQQDLQQERQLKIFNWFPQLFKGN